MGKNACKKMHFRFYGSIDFESVIYNFVEEFVAGFDYSDDNYSQVTFPEMVEVIKSLKTDSSPEEDGVHNRFLKN